MDISDTCWFTAHALTAWVNRNGAVEENSWLQGLLERKHYNVAVVAMAAKTARIMWSMLTHNTEYQPPACLTQGQSI
jgi:hypothetical protein